MKMKMILRTRALVVATGRYASYFDERSSQRIVFSLSLFQSDHLCQYQNQDHYGLLGLAHLRFQATDDDIKRACEK